MIIAGANPIYDNSRGMDTNGVWAHVTYSQLPTGSGGEVYKKFQALSQDKSS